MQLNSLRVHVPKLIYFGIKVVAIWVYLFGHMDPSGFARTRTFLTQGGRLSCASGGIGQIRCSVVVISLVSQW